MGYTIRVLSNDEFDELPYGRARQAFGLADPSTNEVYIRHTNISDLNKYLLDHELDHLVEEVPTDEIDGIRYKIPLGGAISSAARGIGGIASKALPAIGGAFKSVAGGIGRGAQGLGNLLLPGNPFGGGNAPASPLQSFGGGGGLPRGAGIQMPSSTGGAPPQFLSSPQMSQQKSLINPMSKLNPSMLGPQAPGTAPAAAATQAGKPSFFDDILGQLKGEAKESINLKNILGAGSTLIGLGKGNPEVPPLPPSVDALESQIQGGGSPLGQLGQLRLTEGLNEQFNPLSEPEIQAVTRQLDLEQSRAEDQVRDLYRNLRPGSDPSSDSSFKRDLAEVQDRFATIKADALAGRTRDLKQNFDQNRRLQIQQSLGASDQQMQQLMQIANLDIQQIMTQLRMDYESAQKFKDTFLNLGNNLLGV